jgi:DNA-binding CsgD family transcriptional regulator
MTTNTLSQSVAGEDAAGVLVLAADGTTAFADDAAAVWIDELGGRRSITSLASTVATGPGIASACVQAESGRWLVVRASVLADQPDAQVAVLIEPARPHELAPLVAEACGLTEREREVTQLVARGLSTDAIAERLYMSPWTVQDHLKAIFEKVGVATRGELVARLFFQQRLPEL